MSNWYQIATGDQISYGTVRIRNPEVSFPHTPPADLSHLGYLPLDAVEPPLAPTPQDEVVEGPPEEYTQGRMRQTWIIQPRPEPLPAEFDSVLYDAVRNLPLAWSD